MIIFDQLRVSDDGKIFYLDAHVNTNSDYTNVYIDKIAIVRDNEMSETTSTMPSATKCVWYEDSLNLKTLNRVLTTGELNTYATTQELPGVTDLSHNIFYVYIHTTGTPGSGASCADTSNPALGVTYDTGAIYQNGMNFVRELADNCSVPNGFINFILNNEALKASLGTGHYVAANGYFKTLMGLSGGSNSAITSKPCGCHG